MTTRDIGQVSNEFEFGLEGINAAQVIELGRINDLELVPEVNPLHVVELNVSLANTVDELNSRAARDVENLAQLVESHGGLIYGGGSVLADVSDIEPRWQRTTSLSQSMARGFMDITSLQIVLGVTDEQLGFDLYETLRAINPLMLALSANSPYRNHNGRLEDTGAQSRRIAQYAQLCRFYPDSAWREMPDLCSVAEYLGRLQDISDEVKARLADGLMDPNMAELTRVRHREGKEFSYFPFERLEPHQIYWSVRPRTDHRTIEQGGSSVFSLEVRIPDMPTSIQGIQMINSFVLGIGYYVAEHGKIAGLTPTSWKDLEEAALRGIEEPRFRRQIEQLRDYALIGLAEQGMSPTPLMSIPWLLEAGSEANRIRALHFTRSEQLIKHLAGQLRGY